MTDSENSTIETRSSDEEPDTEDDAFLCSSDGEEEPAESDEDEVAALRKDPAYQDVDRIQAQQAAAQAAAGHLRRSGRKRKIREQYQDPHFISLMTDNNKDVLSSESEPENDDDDDDEFSPLQGGEYSLDDASSSDESLSGDE